MKNTSASIRILHQQPTPLTRLDSDHDSGSDELDEHVGGAAQLSVSTAQTERVCFTLALRPRSFHALAVLLLES